MGLFSKLQDGWKCPDCCHDLDTPILHPSDWRFCPYTGRPRGVLHVTPRELQKIWDRTFTLAIDLDAEDVMLGFLAASLAEVRGVEPSYLGGDPHYLDAPHSDAGDLGHALAELGRRRLEIRDHLGTLATKQRGRVAFDGSPLRLPHEPKD